MPNNLIDRIRKCQTFSKFETLLNDNEMVFDSFHYGVGGYCYS